MLSLEERAERELDRERHGRPQPVTIWRPDPTDRFTLPELTEPPPPQRFITKPFLPAGCACVIQAAGGASKTGVMVAMAVAVLTGEPFVGEAVEQGAVWFITAEDRRDTLRRHFYANTRHLADLSPLAGALFVKDVVGLDAKLTRHVDGQTVVSYDVDEMVTYAHGIPNLRLVILDTLSRFNGAEENNEGLARVVEGMERIARETGAAVLIAHHTGKAQMRADLADQYGGRGGSALSDNARSVMHISKVTAETKDPPTNAGDLIDKGLLLRLSHVKSNYSAPADDVWIERQVTPHAAQLKVFVPSFVKSDGIAECWESIADWMRSQTDVAHPTKQTLEHAAKAFASRATVRAALQFAIDRGLLEERPHPKPQAGRKTFLTLPTTTTATAYRRRKDNG